MRPNSALWQSQACGWAGGRIGRHGIAWLDPAGISGGAVAEGRRWLPRVSPQKLLHVNSSSCMNKTQFQAQRSQMTNQRKSIQIKVFSTLQYFSCFAAVVLQRLSTTDSLRVAWRTWESFLCNRTSKGLCIIHSHYTVSLVGSLHTVRISPTAIKAQLLETSRLE